MYRIFLALRYLWSRPISWVSMVGIWLSVTALIATISIMTGFLRETRTMIRGTTSDFVLTPRRTFEDGELAKAAPTFREVAAAVDDAPGVAGLSPHLLRPALIRNAKISPDIQGNRRYFDLNFVQLVGVDPELEPSATDFGDYVRNLPMAGEPPDDPSDPFHVDPAKVPARVRNQDLPTLLIGEKLYEWYGVTKGDVITLVTLPDEVNVQELAPLSQRFIVAGAFRTGHFEFDRSVVFCRIEDARAFAETSTEASEICLQVEPDADVETVRRELRARLVASDLNVEVETWEDRNAKFLGAVENERSILGILLFFFVAVACFNVFATITIMVTDKTKDIGVLNTIGATRRGVLAVFLWCGGAMSFSSSILGCATGVLLAININHVNDALAAVTGERIFNEEVYLFRQIPVDVQPWFVVVVFISTNLFAVLCALLPALRAARMDPVKALRYE